jgi:hypothetical protein
MKSVAIAALSLALLQCYSRGAEPTTKPAAATKPAAMVAGEWALVCHKTLDDTPFTEAQLKEFRAVVDDANTTHQDVWYAHVLYTRKDDYRIAVYFTPESQSGRVRRGECMILDGRHAWRERREPMGGLGEADWRAMPYVQVVPSTDATNGGTTAAEKRAPAIEHTPFKPPKGISDEDLVGVVDAARRKMAEIREFDPMPIMSVEKDGDHGFEVSFGWALGPLYGRGSSVTVERDGKSFKVSEQIGHWVS